MKNSTNTLRFLLLLLGLFGLAALVMSMMNGSGELNPALPVGLALVTASNLISFCMLRGRGKDKK